MLYFAYRLGRKLAICLPLRLSYRVAVALADIYYVFACRDKKEMRHNLQIVLTDSDEQSIKRHIREIFRNFAKYLVDFFRFSVLSPADILKKVSVEGKENLDAALSNGRGAILLTAHLGNWELGGAIVASLGYQFYAIALAHKDPRINEFFIGQRAKAGVNIIPVGTQLKNCFRVLRDNNPLAILGDRDFSNHGIRTDFFGKPAFLPKGPAIFGLRTEAPIIPSFILRLKDDSFRLVFEKPIETGYLGDSEENAVKQLMRKYISVIEKYIRNFPDQWYAFRRVWESKT